MDTLGFRTPAPRGLVSIDGQDAADLDPVDVRSKVFADSHDGVLFRGSVRDNVAAADIPLHERAMAAAAVGDFVSQLPEGTETVLTGHGQSLSGGQRQRLVLGRSLHQQQPVLVLHDPTTAVDTATEAVIADGLRNFPDKALVLVTTSPTLLAVCHRVVMGGGGGSVGNRHAPGTPRDVGRLPRGGGFMSTEILPIATPRETRRAMWRLLAQRPGRLALTVFVLLAAACCGLAAPAILGIMVNIAAGGGDVMNLLWLAIGLLVAGGCGALLGILGQNLLARICEEALRRSP